MATLFLLCEIRFSSSENIGGCTFLLDAIWFSSMKTSCNRMFMTSDTIFLSKNTDQRSVVLSGIKYVENGFLQSNTHVYDTITINNDVYEFVFDQPITLR